jgi:tetratricopeptide (TPR) repeat protein
VKRKQNRTKPDKARPKTTAPEPRAASARLVAACALLVVLLAATPYLNTFANTFVLDDIGIIVENPLVRSAGNIREIFTTNYWSRGQKNAGAIDPGLYRPLTVWSYAVDYRLGGLDPTGYHAVNLALHALASVLVFFIAFDLLSPLAAFAAAAIFAVHPVHTEAVTGIVGRAEVLATVFFLLAFWFARVPVPREHRPFHRGRALLSMSAAGLFYLLGLFSKESAATLPAVLLVYDYIRREEIFANGARRSPAPPSAFVFARYVVFAVAAGIYFLFRAHAVTAPSNIWVGFVGVTAGQRILTASRVLMEYLLLLFFPVSLSAEYWKEALPIARSLEPAVLLSLGLWALLGYVAFWSARKARTLLFALAWMFITLLPVSNILFPIGVGKAERILYLASAGFCLGAGWLYERVEKKVSRKALLPLAFAPLVLILALRTYYRNFDWKDDLTLALATLKQYPNSPLMSNRAGLEYHKRGDKEKALPLLEQSVRERPDSAAYRINLGEVYDAYGRTDDAIREFNIALQLDPSSAEVHNDLGAAYFSAGRIDPAIEHFRRAVSLKPDLSDAHSNLGGLYLMKNNYAEAIRELDTALKLNPDNAEALNNLGTAYIRQGRINLAIEQYQKALRLKPDYADARENLKIAEQAAIALPKTRR